MTAAVYLRHDDVGDSGKPAERRIALAGVSLVADPAGALFWPEERLLAVSDLHLEKGSSFAARGILLPPYDTAATLVRLAQLIAFYTPRTVVALGDNFHDGGGAQRLGPDDRRQLLALQRGREWVWITGNHDPDPADGVGGRFADALAIGGLSFRHEPLAGVTAEIAGHLHPVARVVRRGRMISRRCFAGDRHRVVMPAFGAYTGGLNIHHRAFDGLFEPASAMVYMLGESRVYAIAAGRCLID